MQRAKVLALADRRTKLESDLEELRQALDNTGVGMSASLTPGGYPRNDIDISAVLEMRALYRRKENDLRKLMEEMHVALQEVFKRPNEESLVQPKP